MKSDGPARNPSAQRARNTTSPAAPTAYRAQGRALLARYWARYRARYSRSAPGYESAYFAACTAVATGFYLSYIPVKLIKILRIKTPSKWTGAGFVGSLLGWISLYGLPSDPIFFSASVIAGIFLASWASTAAEKHFGTHDDSRIIIDEVVGYWVAATWLPHGTRTLLAAFVLFRFFDSVKLPPYRWLERLPGGYGVVMDDVGAGIVANILLRLLLRWIPS